MGEQERAFDAKVFLSHVATLPGVYQMRDADGVVLYVGKAKNLRKRLASYFRSNGLSVKTRALMEKVVDIETTITHSETEALILENNLIKTHRPKFNILLRDDKSFPFIYLSAHAFPRLGFARGRRLKGEYFGPFPNVQAVRYSLDLLQKVFRVRQCEDSFFANRSRPCLQYQIERCYAPCVGYINEKEYAQTVNNTRDFLNGRSEALLGQLSEQMMQAAQQRAYEQAAMLRDQLAQLRKVTEKQHIIAGEANVDVLAVALAYGQACVQVLFYRDGHNITSQAYFPKLPDEVSEAEVLSAFIAQFYYERQPAPQLVVNQTLDDSESLAAYLSERFERKITIQSSPREERRKWLLMAEKNAQSSLNLRLSAKLAMQKRFEALAQAFGWQKVPARIECVDISHTQGESTVASCVVFDHRGAVKSDYRRYNIKGITAGDDYAAIAQVIERRFSKLDQFEGVRPDLVLIDGGKGQLKQAMAVFERLGIEDIALMGVAKGQNRTAGLEQFWLPNAQQPFFLLSDSQAMQLIVQIRDEAHRFAITGHRARRAKKAKGSVLEQIPNVGAKRRQALLKHFGGLAMIEQASVEEIARVSGISDTLAADIYATFHQ